MHHVHAMQTDGVTENTQDGGDPEARRRSSEKYRKLFFWLTLILPILMVPGYFSALARVPQTSEPNLLFGIGPLFWNSLAMLPAMLMLLWMLRDPSIYGKDNRFFPVMGAVVCLSIVNGCFWFLSGGLVAVSADDPSDTSQSFAILFIFVGAPAALLAVLVGSLAGLFYSSPRMPNVHISFRKPNG